MIIRRVSRQKLLLLLGDILIVDLSVVLAHFLRLKKHLIFTDWNRRLVTLVFLLVIYIISFYIFDLYNVRQKFRRIRTVVLVFGSLILVALITTVFFYIFPYRVGRGIFLISLVPIAVLITTWRWFFFLVFRLTVPQRNVLIVGISKKARDLGAFLDKNDEYRVIGFISEKRPKEGELGSKLWGDAKSLKKLVYDYNVHDIVLASEPVGDRKMIRALMNCKLWGVKITDTARFYEHLLNKLPVKDIDEEWVLKSEGFNYVGSRMYDRIKRLMDLAISLLILIVTVPVGVIIALGIKLNSKGPVFFNQERVGKHYKPFKLLKFRTMILNSEDGVPQWAEKNDLRVTGFGRILRKMRMDELPQLLNVMKGQMSLIGPRPEREYFVNKLINDVPYYSLRFSVKPGLTGWAQVNYRYGASVEDAIEKLQYELYYIKNMSILLDLRIILKTFRIMLFGLGR